MVVEKLIKKNQVIHVPYVNYRYIDGVQRYHFAPQTHTFNVVAEYWYDGCKFYIGCYEEKPDNYLIEATTFMHGATLGGKMNMKKLIDWFKKKLDDTHKTIHEVIRDAQLRNFDLEAWTNLLII